MALVDIYDHHRGRMTKVRVCDYCRRACIPSGRFCSGHCARNYWEMLEVDRQRLRLKKIESDAIAER